MTSSAGSNRRLITLKNAPPFANDVFVIKIGAAQFGNADGFEMYLALKEDESLSETVKTHIQPTLNSTNRIAFGVNGTFAGSLGNDPSSFFGPSQFENP